MKQAWLPLALLAILLAALGAIGIYYLSLDEREQTDLREGLGLESESAGQIKGSGFIEARMGNLSTAEGGRLSRLEVEIGDRVRAGDRLLQMQNDTLDAELRQTSAALKAARAQRDALEGSQALPEEVAVAEAALQLAQIRVGSVRYRLDQLDLRAPEPVVETLGDADLQADARDADDGASSADEDDTYTVIDIFAREGESLPPGAALLRLGTLDPLRLTIFVAEQDIDALEIGQDVEIEVDAYSDERFDGEIAAIASEAEFTPQNVLTQDERASLVYAVEILLPNPRGKLKPGMPADAFIEID